MSACGLLGTLSSISINMVGLLYLPNVIETRDVSSINQPLSLCSVVNYLIWFMYALIRMDPFMSVS